MPLVDVRVGSRVGNFFVEERIGRGGIGVVYRARNHAIDRTVAIKFLDARAAKNTIVAERFLAEARVLNKVRHPSIVEVFDFGKSDEGELYYMMELLEGRTLEQVLCSEGALAPSRALQFLEQICEALGEVHAHGAVHRDLKPSNLFVTGDDPPRLKLLDFGIVKLLSDDLAQVSKTRVGVVVGTPRYMAPEQARGETDAVGPHTDVYSVGLIAYRMLSGRHAFEGRSAKSLVTQQAHEMPPPLLESAPQLPAPIAAVIERCLEKEPRARFDSAQALVDALRAAFEPDGADALEVATAPYSPAVERLSAANPSPRAPGSLDITAEQIPDLTKPPGPAAKPARASAAITQVSQPVLQSLPTFRDMPLPSPMPPLPSVTPPAAMPHLDAGPGEAGADTTGQAAGEIATPAPQLAGKPPLHRRVVVLVLFGVAVATATTYLAFLWSPSGSSGRAANSAGKPPNAAPAASGGDDRATSQAARGNADAAAPALAPAASANNAPAAVDASLAERVSNGGADHAPVKIISPPSSSSSGTERRRRRRPARRRRATRETVDAAARGRRPTKTSRARKGSSKGAADTIREPEL
ncbi:MAG: serine/threonine protein kinase [Myxococcales bacterium]|nr:serine/threonine protein kinase [Myxococcales bacterium]